MPIFEGRNLVWGVVPIKPVTDAPPGKMRIRLRNTAVGRAFIRDEGGIRHFVLADDGDHWSLIYEQGSNKTLKS
jgi:hypothetical protein